jgi:hypothetical protein
LFGIKDALSALKTVYNREFGSIYPLNIEESSYTLTIIDETPGLIPGYNLRPVSRKIRPFGQFNVVAADNVDKYPLAIFVE